MAVALYFKGHQPSRCLEQFRLGRSCAHGQFPAALFIRATAGVSAIDFDCDLIEALAVLPQLCLNGIAALRTFGEFRLELLHAFGLVADILAQLVDSRIE